MFEKVTESASRHDHLEQKSTLELLTGINEEDHGVPAAVKQAIPMIEALVDAAFERMQAGGRLFYLGSGTSGRLGIVDASECPPTFGVPHDWVIGLIAGGDEAIRQAKEFAEDDPLRGWKDLQQHEVDKQDFVIGITASGTTPYVLGTMEACEAAGIATGGITCNPSAPLSQRVSFPVEVIVGPEFVTGSTRMKAGTAQKLVLNMISTSLMIKLGRVQGNRMVDMQLTNQKLLDRGTKMIMASTDLAYEAARKALTDYGSVRRAVANWKETHGTTT